MGSGVRSPKGRISEEYSFGSCSGTISDAKASSKLLKQATKKPAAVAASFENMNISTETLKQSSHLHVGKVLEI